MTATKFQIVVCDSTLARGRGPYMLGGEGQILTAGATEYFHVKDAEVCVFVQYEKPHKLPTGK